MKIIVQSCLLKILISASVILGGQLPAKKFCFIKETSDIVALFPRTPYEFEEWTSKCILAAQEALNQIISIPREKRSYINTVEAFDNLYLNADIAVMRNVLDIIQRVHPDKEIREAAASSNTKIQDFYITHADTNIALYQAIKEYVDFILPQDPIAKQERFVLDEIMRRFRLSGLHLPINAQNEIKRLKGNLVPLMQQFEKNIFDDNRTVAVMRQDLEGLSDDFINSLKISADGYHVLEIDSNTRYQIMAKCSVEATRKKMYLAYTNRGFPYNEALLIEIMRIRDELAKASGFPSYAHLDLAGQMAGSPENVKTFLYDLLEKSITKKADEFKRFSSDLPDSVKLTPDGKMRPWDVSYAWDYYLKNHAQYDSNLISEYFPLEQTLERLLNVYEQFLGLTFTCISCTNLWDPEVRLIQVAHKQQVIGYILLDLYPRANKYTGGCHASIVPCPKDASGNPSPTLSCIIVNLPKSTLDKPALLKLQDLVTIFHELGHAVHAMLGRTFINPFSPMRIQTDFLEVPSQMFQEWVWDPEILKRLSCHYISQEQLSDELINKILKKDFSQADYVLWLTCFSLFSIECYKNGGEKDPHQLFYDLESRTNTHQKISKKTHFYASLLHLISYGSRGYSYLWSQVYSIDLFNEIKKHGLLNQETGKRFIQEVLRKGDREDPNQFLKEFLGHEVSQEPFLQRMGLI